MVSILANHWAEKGWDITILTFDDGSEPSFYPLHSNVTHRPLDLNKQSNNLLEKLVNNVKRVLTLRKAIKKNPASTVISAITQANILTLVATLGLNRPTIVWEHNDPEFSYRSNVWRILRDWLYPLASRIVLLTESSVPYFSKRVQKKSVVILNPVIKPILFGDVEKEPADKKILLAMGRLTKQKGFDLLLRAFAKISPNCPDWIVQIWGYGPLQESLEKLRDELNLKDKVQFPGLTKKPYDIMTNADIFVMSSRWEGLPMVLGEAMACGMPVICFSCHGPRDIIRDGVDGILIPPEDVQALSEGLETLMKDDEKRKQLSVRSTEVLKRFGLEEAAAKWESLFSEISD